jgi:transcriptional antiterminator
MHKKYVFEKGARSKKDTPIKVMKWISYNVEKIVGQPVNDDEAAYTLMHFEDWLDKEGLIPHHQDHYQ